MPRLEIRLLGPFEVTSDGEPVTAFETESARALLAYLAADPGHVRSRAAVAEMLWPDRPQGAALSNLRHVLSVLRRALGDADAPEPAILTDRSTVTLDPSGDLTIDLVEFERLAAIPAGSEGDVESWARAIDLWRGPLLEGLSIRAGAEWEEWLVITTERVRRVFASVLGRLADNHERAAEWDVAIPLARRLVEVDPWEERGHRRLMRLLSRSGGSASALKHFADLEQRLSRELAASPEPETSALADQIRAGDIERFASDAELAYPVFLATEPVASPPLFVGRKRELDELDRHLEAALAGRGTIVFVSGEAGSGKTLLTREFMRQAMRVPDLLVAAGNCNAFGGLGDPYLPFRELLGLLCGNVESGYTAGALDREQATRLWEAIPHSARLVSELAPGLLGVMVNGALLVDRAEHALPGASWIEALRDRVEAMRPGLAPERLQPALFDDYAAVLERLSITRPLVLVIDDLQWADRGTVALLWHLARRLEGMRVLLVAVYRPEEMATDDADGPSLLDVVRDLEARYPSCVVELHNDRAFVDEYLDSEPNALAGGFRDRLYAYTGGHPLFTVELVRGMQERAELRRDRAGVWRARGSLDWDRLPSRVEAVVAQRVARLPEDLRRDLAIASVQGQDFIAEIVGDVASDEGAIRRLGRESSASHRLIDPSGVDRVGDELVGRHRFRHVLFQLYLYDRLDPADRIRLHEATGRALEVLYRGQQDPPVVDLARHFEEAGLPEPAIAYLHLAGQRAIRMAASEEAIGLLERGLALVGSLPASTGRDDKELALLTTLAAPVMAVRGYAAPDAERIADRVLALHHQRLDQSPTMVLALTGMATVLSLRGQYPAAAAVSEEAVEIGETMAEPPGLTIKARQVLGYDRTWMGELGTGHEALDRAHREFDPWIHGWLTDATGSSPGPDALVWDAINTLHRGHPHEAIELGDRGIALARHIGHAFTLCHALAVGGSVLRAMSGDFAAAIPFIDEVEAIADDEHFPFYSVAATIHRGQADGHRGDPAAGIEAITEGLEAWRSIGIEAFRGPFLGDVAEFHHRVGSTRRGLEVIESALEDARAHEERLTEVTLLVQQGELLAAAGDATAARAALDAASTAAHRAGMVLLELRARTALLRLADSDHRAAAREALAAVCSSFDDDLDTPHVTAARRVLADT